MKPIVRTIWHGCIPGHRIIFPKYLCSKYSQAWSHKYRLVSNATHFSHHITILLCGRHVSTQSIVRVLGQFPKDVETISQNSHSLSHGWRRDFFRNIPHTSGFILLIIKTFSDPQFLREPLEKIIQDFVKPNSVWKITNTVRIFIIVIYHYELY